MPDPEMAKVEYGPTGSRMWCKCGNEPWYVYCTRSGRATMTGPCLGCIVCGRVYSADGVVLTRTEVKA